MVYIVDLTWQLWQFQKWLTLRSQLFEFTLLTRLAMEGNQDLPFNTNKQHMNGLEYAAWPYYWSILRAFMAIILSLLELFIETRCKLCEHKSESIRSFSTSYLFHCPWSRLSPQPQSRASQLMQMQLQERQMEIASHPNNTMLPEIFSNGISILFQQELLSADN